MSDAYCACGCGGGSRPKPANRPARHIHGHNPVTRTTPDLAARFWPRVAVGTDDECWLWLGGHDAKDGRGRIWYQGRNIPAPRAALTLSGVEVPAGAFVCHHCDNPPCVNPRHLYVGDAASNVADMIQRGRRVVSCALRPAQAGEHNHAARLTDQQVDDIRAAYTGARGEQSALARAYGVTPQLVHMIVRGKHRAAI